MVVGQILVGPNHDLGSDAGTYQILASGAVFGVIANVTRITGLVLVGIPVIVASDLPPGLVQTCGI